MDNGQFLKNVISEKSFFFAVRIVELSRMLIDRESEYVLSKQILRSGTSIGANVAEAQQAQNLADFTSKMSIALKEASETEYWIRLLVAVGCISETEAEVFLAECIELIRMLSSIVRTSKSEK